MSGFGVTCFCHFWGVPGGGSFEADTLIKIMVPYILEANMVIQIVVPYSLEANMSIKIVVPYSLEANMPINIVAPYSLEALYYKTKPNETNLNFGKPVS